MEVVKTLLAIDGGATKTAVKVIRTNGEQLLSTVGRGSNYQALGEQQVYTELTSILNEVASLHVDIDAAVFAIAGIDTEKDLTIVQNIVARSIASSSVSIKHYVVENDVEAAMRGLCRNKPGALVISGTGAIGYSYDGSKTFRVGGWGHRVGDEGSGYWIGQAVVQAVFQAMDGRGEQTALTKYVLDCKGFANTDELMNWLYRADYRNADLASFGSLLQSAVCEGDCVAVKIAGRAADELSLLAVTLLKQMNWSPTSQQTMTFYLNGGVLKNNPSIYHIVEKEIVQFAPNVEVALCNEKPIDLILNRARFI